MKRIGPLLAVSVAILAVGYMDALVEWGAHNPGWLIGVAFTLVCIFLAAGGPAIDLFLDARTARRRGVSRPSSLPRVGRSPSTSDGSSSFTTGSVHARAATRPRARASGRLSR